MPSRDRHIEAARDNQALAENLLGTSWKGWAAIAAFYSALHWVDAYLATMVNGIHPNSHESRENAIARFTDLRPIQPHYGRLRTASERARYFLAKLDEAEVRALLEEDLRLVREHIKGLIGSGS